MAEDKIINVVAGQASGFQSVSELFGSSESLQKDI